MRASLFLRRLLFGQDRSEQPHSISAAMEESILVQTLYEHLDRGEDIEKVLEGVALTPGLVGKLATRLVQAEYVDKFLGLLRKVKSDPTLDATITPELIEKAADVTLQRSWAATFVKLCEEVAGNSHREAAIHPSMIALATEDLIDFGRNKDIERLRTLVRDNAEKEKAIDGVLRTKTMITVPSYALGRDMDLVIVFRHNIDREDRQPIVCQFAGQQTMQTPLGLAYSWQKADKLPGSPRSHSSIAAICAAVQGVANAKGPGSVNAEKLLEKLRPDL